MLICEKAFMNGKNIMCRISGNRCAHVKLCQLTGKFRQTESAKDCPGRGKDENTHSDSVHAERPDTVFSVGTGDADTGDT